MYKKILQITLALVFSLSLLSCKMDSEVVYHKDAASTMEMNADMTQLLAFAQMGGAEEMDSLKNQLGKIPKTFTSLYDIKLKEGEKMSNHPDSVKLYKKTFLKSNYDGDDFTGISMKMDHFTAKDLENLKKNDGIESQSLKPTNFLGNWDGKNLTINTADLNFDSLKEAMGEDGESLDDPEQLEQMKMVLNMMDFEFKTKLKFETPIKNIQGKHDWVKQIDDKTIEVDYNLKKMLDESYQFQNKDAKIIVTTT